MQSRSQAGSHDLSWEFTLTRTQVSPEEQVCFAKDLARLGLDEVAWLILNGTVATGTDYSIPKVLRGYHGGNLAGVAYLTECQHYGQSLFPETPAATLIDVAPVPICIWMRHGALTDAICNPGFVAEGVAREEFIEAAITILRQSYLLGGVLEGETEQTAGSYATFPFCDYGIVELHAIDDLDDLYKASKNLKRKVKKFRNKGGEIEIVRGALSPALCHAAIECLNSLKTVLISPFQDNYNNMVLRASAHDDDRLLHIIARIDGEFVGYHSFAWSGDSLYCLSGGFDRTRHSNYHAYENVILASMQFGLERGLPKINYGPIVNATKAKMMSRFEPVKQRYFARFSPLTGAVRTVMSATRLTSSHITSFANLATSTADAAMN